jgi:hypothetical protein
MAGQSKKPTPKATPKPTPKRTLTQATPKSVGSTPATTHTTAGPEFVEQGLETKATKDGAVYSVKTGKFIKTVKPKGRR